MTPDPKQSELPPIERLLSKILHRAYSTSYREKGHVCDFRQAIESIVMMTEAFLDERKAVSTPDLQAECAAWQHAFQQIYDYALKQESAACRDGETDAYCVTTNWLNSIKPASNAGQEFAERLKRAEEERDAWKASHDNQVKLRRALMARPDLKDRAKSIQELTQRVAELEQKCRELNAQAGQWRPIETAPKNGTVFFAPWDGEVRRVLWCKTPHVPLYGWHDYHGDPELRDMIQPTVWMPLPAMPETKEGDAR